MWDPPAQLQSSATTEGPWEWWLQWFWHGALQEPSPEENNRLVDEYWYKNWGYATKATTIIKPLKLSLQKGKAEIEKKRHSRTCQG